MNILPFLAICTVGAFLTLLAQPIRILARVLGLASLVAALGSTLALNPSVQVTVGSVQLQTTWYVGLFLTVGIAGCLILCLLGLASGWPERLSPAALATFGGLGVALTSLDPGVALLAAAAAATPAALVAINSAVGTPGTAASTGPGSLSAERLAGVRVAELRILALVIGGAMLAAIGALLPNWTDDPSPVYALAFFALALAIAVRCGAVPFHVPTARLSTTSARLGLPLVLVWIPAGLTLIALNWSTGTYGIESDWLTYAIAAIQVIGVATLVLGAIGALLHEEIEEIAAYSIVQDAGFIMLALAARNDGAGEPLRLWLLAFVLAKSALVAWITALAWMFGSSHLQDLRGWVRRAPVLAVALVAIVVATLGWPGSPIFEARSTLVDLGLPSPLHWLSLAAVGLALLYYGRLLAVGFLSPGEWVLSAEGERPILQAPQPLPEPTAKPAMELALELATSRTGGPGRTAGSSPMASPQAPRRSVASATARDSSGRPARRSGSAVGRAVSGVASLWRLNHRLEASVLVLIAAALAVSVAFGGFGASGAARTGTALDVGPGQTEVGPVEQPPSEAPSETPAPTSSTGPSAPAGSAAPSPSAPAGGSPTAAPSGSASAQPSFVTGN